MGKLHRISVQGQSFVARSGQRLLDAAIAGGVDMPHDCRAGRCGACLCRVRQGITLGGETRQAGMVHACQAMVFSDLALELEPLPPVDSITGRVSALTELARGIVEVAIQPVRRLEMLQGQYVRVRFRGFPDRAFSPTSPLGTLTLDGTLRFHIKRVRDGRVTPQLGRAIGVGHAVAIDGPFGHAFLRPGLANRLVLVGSGTGFAPVWAVAAAALRENPTRRIALIAATRRLDALYMAPALELARRYPGVSILASVDELPRRQGVLAPGPAAGNLPPLAADDIVYAAGAPALVDTIADVASSAGATFYADPFEITGSTSGTWLDTARAWLTGT